MTPEEEIEEIREWWEAGRHFEAWSALVLFQQRTVAAALARAEAAESEVERLRQCDIAATAYASVLDGWQRTARENLARAEAAEARVERLRRALRDITGIVPNEHFSNRRLKRALNALLPGDLGE